MDDCDGKGDVYRRIFENTGTAMFVFDDDGLILFANKAFERLTGLTRGEIEGKKRWTDFEDNDDDLPCLTISSGARALDGAGGPKCCKFRMTIMPIEETAWRLAMLQDPSVLHGDTGPDDGKGRESLCVESQKLEALGTLSDGIAREFDNILMGIHGYTSLMHFQKEGEHPHDDKLQNIEQLVEKGVNLTKQLLAFAQTGMYEVCNVDMNQLLEESSEMFALTKREIRISRDLQADLMTVKADRAQLNQVFMNLYINAWQAMTSGGDLYIGTRNVHLSEKQVVQFGVQAGPYIEIVLKDTGIGMDEKILSRVFEPFFTTREADKGNGLGLAFVYGVIRSHGGMIRIASEKGNGATVSIYFPAFVEVPPVEKQEPEKTGGGKETILIVDDEEINIDVMQEWLDILGYNVLTAQNGHEAIDIYRQQGHEIDLVILDMIMPGMNGGDVFDVMKEINPQVRAILSSGYSIDGKATEILQRGIKAFIQKPFRIDSLAQKIKEILAS
jgi:two-component system, cell cycle sensor histidine kinase and response regulator CckA